MLTGTTLNIGVAQLPGRSRRCAIWISPWADLSFVIDTAALAAGDARHAGADRFPADCLLVVVHPRTYRQLVDAAIALPYETSGPAEAAAYLDRACARDPDLARRLRWTRTSAPGDADRRE